MEERRTSRRYKLALEAKVARLPAINTAMHFRVGLHDISSEGISFLCEQELSVGGILQLSFIVPVEINGAGQVTVDAQARIVRVTEMPRETAKEIHVAARIERFDSIRKEINIEPTKPGPDRTY